MRKLNKPVLISLYILHALILAALYGVVAFFVIYRFLADGVMLRAYIWNIVFIVVLLLLDRLFASDQVLSEELAVMRKSRPISRALHAASYISFKTTLYFFYTFILIASRVSILEPDLFAYEFQRFVLSIEYCLILLVAFDKFTEYLRKDDSRIQRLSRRFQILQPKKKGGLSS